jgi:hypothetical protein
LYNETGFQSYSSRTELYSTLHRFLVDKACDRMRLDHAVMDENVLRPLYELAFAANSRGESYLTKRDFAGLRQGLLQDLLAAGFLVEEIQTSRVGKPNRLSFSHRTFQEYLSALHVQYMTDEARTEFATSLDLQTDTTITRFILGTLEGQELCAVASIVLEKIPTDDKHVYLRLLSEIRTSDPEILRRAMANTSPTDIRFDKRCTDSCYAGLPVFLASNPPPYKTAFHFSYDCLLPPKLPHILVELLHHEPPVFSDLKLDVQKSSIRLSQLSESHNAIFRRSAYKMTLSLKHCDQALTEQFLKAAESRPLIELHLNNCTMSMESLNILATLLHSNPQMQSLSLVELQDCNSNAIPIGQLVSPRSSPTCVLVEKFVTHL